MVGRLVYASRFAGIGGSLSLIASQVKVVAVGPFRPTNVLYFQVVVGAISLCPTVANGSVYHSVSTSQCPTASRVQYVSCFSYGDDGGAKGSVAITVSYAGRPWYLATHPTALMGIEVQAAVMGSSMGGVFPAYVGLLTLARA